MLDVAAANIKQAQKVQARAYNTKHARNAFAIGEKVWRMNPLWSTKLKALRKGPKWFGPCKIMEWKGGGNGNYVLKCLSGKNKGKKSTRVHTPVLTLVCEIRYEYFKYAVFSFIPKEHVLYLSS